MNEPIDVDALRVELLNQQFQLRQSNFAAIVLIAGDDRPGAVEVLRTLHEWMDARYLFNVITFGADPAENAERPILSRYWRRLPPTGRIGVFLGGWPTSVLRTGIEEGWSDEIFAAHMAEINSFEQQQVDHGTLLLKFWLHLPEATLRARMAAAEQNPQKHWDFAQHDWEIYEREGDVYNRIQTMVAATSTETVPWRVLDSTQLEDAAAHVGTDLVAALSAKLASSEKKAAAGKSGLEASAGSVGFPRLAADAMLPAIEKEAYKVELAQLQARLNELSLIADESGLSSVVLFEGVDAAGKGGSIRRLVRALPVQLVRVIPISAPNEAERARHYLWRFWTRLPKPGGWTIFDRSWYGRVLVERVEGFAKDDEWQRAYREINEFERSLSGVGMVVTKFWLQIDEDEQAQRFKKRSSTPYKKYKLTDEDIRNREKWDDYQTAAEDMFANTDSEHAPWHVISTNDKRRARLEVLATVIKRLEQALDL